MQTKNQPTLFSLPENEQMAAPSALPGNPRLIKASRAQIEMHWAALDELIDPEHPVRQIWSYVEKLDLKIYLQEIKSIEGNAGRTAIDPKILVALWLYATIEGIGSARVLDRYTNEHLAFKWIYDGVPIARKTISDFRTNNGELFEELLAQGLAILVKAGVTVVEEVAQDGLRVRANAGRGSFRKEESIKVLYNKAKERLERLKKEIEEDPKSCILKQQMAKKQACEAKLKRLEAAQKELAVFLKEKESHRKKHKKKALTPEEKKTLTVSMTDPEARIMKMSDDGFRPAYNFQYAVDTFSKAILGVDVVNAGTDGGLARPMYEKIRQQCGIPKRYLADGGYKNREDIEFLSRNGCEAFIPLQKSKTIGKKADEPKVSEEIKDWRIRMNSESGKEIYRRRASSIELVNAAARKRGLYQIHVRGLNKARGIANLYAITHNMVRSIALGVV